MALLSPELLLPLTALMLGIKHGVDWDHIAAIMDITSVQTSTRSGVFLGFLYAMGHASVVAFFSVAALLIGLSLPDGIDTAMEKAVGITLVLLGGYVFYSLHMHRGDDFRMLPRWALLFNSILYVYDRLVARLTLTPAKHHQVLKSGYGSTSSYVIGMIHGIGAETPSQVVLFVLVASTGIAGGREIGILMILAFALGLTITNTIMAALGAYGYVNSSNKRRLYRSAAFATGSFSLAIGIMFILGGTGYLPDLQF